MKQQLQALKTYWNALGTRNRLQKELIALREELVHLEGRHSTAIAEAKDRRTQLDAAIAAMDS